MISSPLPDLDGLDLDALKALLRQIRETPGIADPRMQQSDDNPQLDFNADRARIAQYGLQEKDVILSINRQPASIAARSPAARLQAPQLRAHASAAPACCDSRPAARSRPS